MASPRSRQAARLRARQRRAQLRARRIALLSIVGVLALVTLLLTAFGTGGGSRSAAVEPLETEPVSSIGTVRPRPIPIARVGNLLVRLPVPSASVTAIGYHGSQDGALALQPLGRQANEGILARLWRSIAGARKEAPRWYQLDGDTGTEVLDVGARAGTDVYSPVDGTVVAISDVVLDGRTMGARIDIRPTDSPSVTVSLTHVKADPALAVGMAVLGSTSKLGTVVDVASVERQALAEHAPEGGNNVAISVYPSPGALP